MSDKKFDLDAKDKALKDGIELTEKYIRVIDPDKAWREKAKLLEKLFG